MARIVGGNPQGEFRGKLGGLVYSRNKTGQIVRGYAKNIDRNSVAQNLARATFAQAISKYHMLTPAEKLAWAEYGNSYFSSVNSGFVPNQFTGINAFTSLNNTILSMSRISGNTIVPDITVNAVAVTGVTGQPLTFQNNAPVVPMSGSLLNYSIAKTIVQSISLSANKIVANMKVIPNGIGGVAVPGATGTGSILRSAGNKPLGFAVKISSTVPQQGVAVRNPAALVLGATIPVLDYVTPAVLTTDMVIEIPISANASSLYYPVENATLRAAIWMFNDVGEQIKLGENWLQVSN